MRIVTRWFALFGNRPYVGLLVGLFLCFAAAPLALEASGKWWAPLGLAGAIALLLFGLGTIVLSLTDIALSRT